MDEEVDYSRYTLGPARTNGSKRTARDVYGRLVKSSNRDQVCARARELAELTCHEVFPPESYKVGDDLPGNNQSLNSYLLCNLSSIIMFLAFPPGQPIMRVEAIDYEVQQQINDEPELWAKMLVALSMWEQAHRKRFQATVMATVYEEYIKLLLLSGNAMWKHLKLDHPTYHRPDCYVVKRQRDGQALIVIHEEKCSMMALDEDVQQAIEAEEADKQAGSDKDEWDREVIIYSCQKLVTSEDGEKSWLYWQETEKGTFIPDSEVETDINTPPMWAGQLIPIPGSDWGRGYAERYRGDLFANEAQSASINDIAAFMAWVIAFVKPGSASNIKQVREAPNLSVLPGHGDDVTVMTTQKSADLNGLSAVNENVARRLSRAFLAQSSVQRTGERVTAEEIVRLGNELDKAMGGVYTGIAQTNQRPIFLRAIALNEEENPKLPPLPKQLAVQVITGSDAMGARTEAQTLREFIAAVNEAEPAAKTGLINPMDFTRRLAAAMGIKLDGLVPTDEQFAQGQQQQQQTTAAQTILDKGTTPAVKGIADAAMQQQAAAPQ